MPAVAKPKPPASYVPHPWEYGEEPLPCWAKAVLIVVGPLVLVPLALVRLCVMLAANVAFFVACELIGSENPAVLNPTLSIIARVGLLAFGVWPGLLRVRQPAYLEPAPVLVFAPHRGLVDAFVLVIGRSLQHTARPIAMEEFTKLPVLRSIFRATRGIAVPVPRLAAPKADGEANGAGAREKARAVKSGQSREAMRQAIAAAVATFDAADDTPPIAFAPEGTSHSGRAVLRFFAGAFEAGAPVQPVVIEYPSRYFNAAFFRAAPHVHLLRLLLTPWLAINVDWLPTRHPTAEEVADLT
jgi:1-acyl-sn-glycerol-3-phosphate acyltransferase